MFPPGSGGVSDELSECLSGLAILGSGDSGTVGCWSLAVGRKDAKSLATLRGDLPEIQFMGRERLALTPDQAQLLHLLEGVDTNPRLLARALIELREIGLARYLPKQILVG